MRQKRDSPAPEDGGSMAQGLIPSQPTPDEATLSNENTPRTAKTPYSTPITGSGDTVPEGRSIQTVNNSDPKSKQATDIVFNDEYVTRKLTSLRCQGINISATSSLSSESSKSTTANSAVYVSSVKSKSSNENGRGRGRRKNSLN